MRLLCLLLLAGCVTTETLIGTAMDSPGEEICATVQREELKGEACVIFTKVVVEPSP